MLVSYEKDAEGLLNFAEANVEHFDPVNFGTLFNRLQKLRNPRLVRDDRFLLCLEYLEKVRARDGQEAFNAFSVSIIAHSLSYFSVNVPFFEMINNPSVSRRLVEEGQPQSLSSTSLALAKLKFRNRPVYKAGKHKKVPNYLLSVDRLGTDKLFSDRKVQSVSNTLHSFALLNCPAPNLARRAENDKSFLKHLMKHGSAQEIATVLWAMTTMGYEAPNLIAYLSNNLDCFFKNRRGIIPTNLSAISTSLAIQGRWAESGAILDEIARDVVRDDGVIDRFMLQGGAGDRSRSKSARKKRQFRTSLHDLIGIAWGLTISTPGIAEDEGAQRLDAVLKLRKVAVDAFPEDSWNIKDATQLRQIEVFLRMEGIEIGEKLTNLKTFTNQKFIDKGSGFEKFVSEALTEIGFKHEREVYPFPSTLGWKTGDKRSFAIDIANLEERIAIEVDGPFHFLSNVNERTRNTGRPSGTTMAKKRLLESLGWKTFNYSYLEHREIIKHVANGAIHMTNEIAVQEYWRQRLGRAGVLLSIPQVFRG